MNKLYFSARFAHSAGSLAECPADARREVAFAGRSNAGKSSAINTITRNGKLARTGRTPGRTQRINHFALGNAEQGLFLVDLPGYGFANVSRRQQAAWRQSMTDYLLHREALVALVLVMDSRHPLTPIDWQLIELQQHAGIGLHLLMTKADKLSKNRVKATLSATQRELEAAGVEATLQDFSSLKRQGVDDAHTVLDSWLLEAAGGDGGDEAAVGDE